MSEEAASLEATDVPPEDKEFDDFLAEARRHAPFSFAGDEAARSFLKMIYRHEVPELPGTAGTAEPPATVEPEPVEPVAAA